MMTDNEPNPTPTNDPPQLDAVSPDELMSDFRGHSLIKILIFTIVVHIFILAIFSPGYIKAQVFGPYDRAIETITLSDRLFRRSRLPTPDLQLCLRQP